MREIPCESTPRKLAHTSTLATVAASSVEVPSFSNMARTMSRRASPGTLIFSGLLIDVRALRMEATESLLYRDQYACTPASFELHHGLRFLQRDCGHSRLTGRRQMGAMPAIQKTNPQGNSHGPHQHHQIRPSQSPAARQRYRHS